MECIALRKSAAPRVRRAASLFGFGFASLAAIILVVQGGSLRLPRSVWIPSLTASLLYSASAFTFYFALAGHSPVYVVAVTAAYPLITLAGSWIRRNERFTARQLAAVTLIVAGVALIQQ